MNWGAILYWIGFGFVVVIWLAWGYAVLFGDGGGFTRSSVESTPTGRDGRH